MAFFQQQNILQWIKSETKRLNHSWFWTIIYSVHNLFLLFTTWIHEFQFVTGGSFTDSEDGVRRWEWAGRSVIPLPNKTCHLNPDQTDKNKLEGGNEANQRKKWFFFLRKVTFLKWRKGFSPWGAVRDESAWICHGRTVVDVLFWTQTCL